MDFVLFQKGTHKNGIGRLLFDAKLANQVSVEVEMQELSIKMDEQLKFLKYNYSLALKNRAIEIESSHSLDIQNPFFAENLGGSPLKVAANSQTLEFPSDPITNPKLKTTVPPFPSGFIRD